MEIGDYIPNLEKNRIIFNNESNKMLVEEGIPTFVHFWSFSCQICKQSLSQINSFREKYKAQINIISVHIPRSEQELQVKIVKEKVSLNKIKHITIVDNQYSVSDKFQNNYVPSFYLFDNLGKLCDKQAGEFNLQVLEDKLIEMIN